MATWHQQQNPRVLYHPTKFTAVTDPPTLPTTVMRFDTYERAKKYCDAVEFSYVLPPQGGNHGTTNNPA
jgi:hypothetical protein